jgi:SAM-dependent methyltransferase
MYKSLLVRMFGFPATLIHGDTLVLDRWRWLKRRLPHTNNGERLLDVGCGTGAFTIGAALRGYTAVGLSWDERNQAAAERRAKICGASQATFRVCDVRELDQYHEYREAFDVAICAENIEHIIDDLRLMRSITACLKPGGRLLLTTPNFYYRAITKSDNGPFCEIETGWHIRRGYTRSMLKELTIAAGLHCEELSYCSGTVSQHVTRIMRRAGNIHPLLGWAVVLPLRPFTILDQLFARWSRTPPYSICLEAYKPRWPSRFESERDVIW